MADRAAVRGPERASTRYAWLTIGLAVWLVIGVSLVVAANNRGEISDIGFSPYHIVGYAGLLALCAVVVVSLDRGVRRLGSSRLAFPAHYGGIWLGAVLFLSWLVADLVWRETIGIRLGIEGGLAPTRLLVPLGLAAVASGPMLDALSRAGGGVARPDVQRGAAAVASTALVLAAIGTLANFNPLINVWMERPTVKAEDSSEIWRMSADGTQQTRLLEATGDGVDASLPAWSPDGTRIAYTRWRNTSDSDQIASVWTIAADGTDARQLVELTDWAWIPTWTPDGTSIVFTLSPVEPEGQSSSGAVAQPQPGGPVGGPLGPPENARRRANVFAMPVAGGERRQLTTGAGENIAGVWSPDGKSLAYVSDRDGDQEIYVLTDAGTPNASDRRLTQDPAEDWSPAWSADGRRIGFTSGRGGAGEIWVVNVDGSGLTRLTDDPGGDWSQVWSPDGSRIAFTSDRTGDPEVWSMAADGSDQRNLTRNRTTVDGQWGISWSPDGKQLVYASSGTIPAWLDSLARDDLGSAGLLIHAILYAIGALLLVRIGPLFGAFAITFGVDAVLSAITSGDWRFVPAAFVGGVLVDIIVRVVPRRFQSTVAATALPVALVLAIAASLAVTSGIGWTPTLLIGNALAVAVFGCGIAVLTRYLGGSPAEAPGVQA